MVAADRHDEYRTLSARAAALTARVRVLLEPHPQCREILRLSREGERYETPRYPAAMALLREADPSAWRRAEALWRQADGYRWRLAQLVENQLRRRTRHLNHASMSRADWEQELLLGAYQGALRWDPRRGSWPQFAAEWAYAHTQRILVRRACMIRMPQGVWDRRRQLLAEQRDAAQPLSAVAGRVGCSLAAARTALLPMECASLDAPSTTGITLAEALADSAPTPEDLVGGDCSMAVAAVLAACRDERERRVMSMRYGLDGSDGMTLAEIAAIEGGVSRERVRQIEQAVLLRARQLLQQERGAALHAAAEAPIQPSGIRRPGVGRPSSVTEATQREILRLYGLGVSQSEAARRTGVARSTVQRICSLSDVVPRPPRPRTKCPVHPTVQSSISTAVCDYCRSAVRAAVLRYRQDGHAPQPGSRVAEALLALDPDDCVGWPTYDSLVELRESLSRRA